MITTTTTVRSVAAAALVAFCLGAPARADDETAPAPDAGLEEAAALLARLVEPHGVSGNETPVGREIRELLKGHPTEVDARGNLTVTLKGEGATAADRIVFVAHLDEIGWVVTEVQDDGLCKVRERGGLDPSIFDAREVVVRTRKGYLPAVVTPRPDTEGDTAGEAVRSEDLRIDVGVDSKAAATALGLEPGCPITVKKHFERLGPHRAVARAMDDRVGCTAQVLALRQLAKIDPARLAGREIVFAFVVEEEVGLLGSQTLARKYAQRGGAKIVFAVDSFVSADNPIENDRASQAFLGKGPVVRAMDRSHMIRPADLARVREIAAKRALPIQVAIMGGGGNDASAWVPYGARSFALAWPMHSAHSATEVVDLRDVRDLARLIAAIAEEM